jgi:hypothetical protein
MSESGTTDGLTTTALTIIEPATGMPVAGGERASLRFIDFFTAHIRNPNTRAAYGVAVARLLQFHKSGFRRLAVHPYSGAILCEPVLRPIGRSRFYDDGEQVEGAAREAINPRHRHHVAGGEGEGVELY